MLEKLANSLVHGNFRTKLFLWSVICMGTAALILLVAALALGMPMLGGAAAGFGFVGFVTSQSVSLNDLAKEKKPKSSGKLLNQGANSSNAKHSGKEGGDGEEANSKSNRENGEQGNDLQSRRKREKEKAQYLNSFDSKKMKKTMKEHKVDQIHVKVMVDSYPGKKIEQSPAVVWRTDTMLHFMILSGSAEEFEVPLLDIKGILLVKNVPVNLQKDYMLYKYSSFISKMFREFLPTYYEKNHDGVLEYIKNTFRIEPGIYLTNTSVANLQRVLLPDVAFLVDDKITASHHFNEYFKEIYRASVMCKNAIIDLEEYKVRVHENLEALLTAPITGEEFVRTVSELNKYHLITRQNVAQYTQKYRELIMDKTT